MLNIKAFKKIFLLLVLTLSISCISVAVNAKEQLPKINFLGIEHSPLVEGDSESFYVTSDYEGRVQYRVWLNKVNTNTWEDITEGYTKAVDAKTPYIISPDRMFAEGKYKLSVWVKKAETEGVNKGSLGSYDTYYIANLNCVKKDDNNRVYVNDSMNIEKDEYTLGEQVIIDGINNISGIKGPYKYKLHYFSPSKANDKNTGWVKNVTDYDDKIVWTPTEPGTYVLDVHVNTETSTTWNTYLKKKKENKADNLVGTYEAWKLKVITVKERVKDENEINLSESNKTYGSLDENNPQVMNKEINFLAENVTLKNIKQTGNINMLKEKAVLNNAEVIGNVNIQGNYSNMYNVKVKGTMTINPGNSGVVYLNNVQADEIQVLSGATESIHLNNVTTPVVIINSSSNVRVVSTGKTVIDKIDIRSNAILENSDSNIKEVEIMARENSEINLKGNYELINVTKDVKLNILEGKINKMNTVVPFTLKLEEGAYVTKLDKNKFEVKVSGKDTNIITVENDNTVIAPVVPPVVTPPVVPPVVTPPVEEKLLENMSVVLSNGQVVNASGSDSVLTVDISNIDELVKLVSINIEVNKECSVNINSNGINKNFNLSAAQSNSITPNDLISYIDTEKDGVSISNIKNYLAEADGYFVTTQKLTSENGTIDVVLKIKVK